jgi:poly-gamma-glutamate synthesis protein (capsule biosynthesis protein)
VDLERHVNANTKKNRNISRRKLRRRRKREKRIYMFTAVFASLCVFALIGLIYILQNGGADADPGAWIVESGSVEIAAPPMNDAGSVGGAVIVATAEPEIPAFIVDEPTAETTNAPETAEVPTIEPEVALSSVTITAAGDCTLGGDWNTDAHERFESYVDEYGYDYFLENVKDIFESDDLTFVNLEGPLTTSDQKRGGRVFNFKGDPENVNILTSASVEVAGVANNHALDFGSSGLKETANVLTDAGVGVCGFSAPYKAVVNGIRVTLMSVTEWDYTIDELTDMLKAQRADCDLLVVMIHWGEERLYSATDSQVVYGRALIDAGADLVLGSHSHVLGGIELYEGKYIVYGLGNFCFGGNANPSDKDAMIFQQTFVFDPDAGTIDGGISVIPVSTSSKAGTNDYRPTPLSGTEALRVLRKIGTYSSVSLDDVKWAKKMDEYMTLAN